MKALVTGGAGYIGSHTCKSLAKAGHEVHVYDNLSTGHRHLARWGGFSHGDILDMASLRACMKEFRPDVIIHFAAKSYVGESVRKPGLYFRNNACGTLNILEAMRDEGVGNIVVSGTCAIYGQPKIAPIAEDCPKEPINPYGASKLFMERMLADFHAAHGLNWVSLRYFNAAGSDPDGETGELHNPETHLIPRAILAALGKIPQLEIFGTDYPTPDGTCIRDYIHVNDLADAHIRAAKHLVGGGECCALNLGAGAGFSVREIISCLERVSGAKVPCVENPRRPGDPARLVANAAKAKNVLGWEPEIPLDAMLEHAWRFLKDNAA